MCMYMYMYLSNRFGVCRGGQNFEGDDEEEGGRGGGGRGGKGGEGKNLGKALGSTCASLMCI